MTNDPVRLVAVDEQRGDGETAQVETAQVLQRLREHTLGLLGGLDREPKSLRIRAGEVEIELEWPQPVTVVTAAAPDGTAAAQPTVQPAAVQPAAPLEAVQAVAGGPPEAAAGAAHHITAHTVGVFHHAPAPGAEPFVTVGDVVAPGQQVGIIEAMKLMISVEAETAGRIVEVLVPNATPVEYGEKLFAFEPADTT